MVHSIVIASGEQEVKQAVRDFQSVGCGIDQILIIAHENVDAEQMLRPKYTSRIGFVASEMAYAMTPVYKCSGYPLREKLASLGLSQDAVKHYEQEMVRGCIIIAVDVKVHYDFALPVG